MFSERVSAHRYIGQFITGERLSVGDEEFAEMCAEYVDLSMSFEIGYNEIVSKYVPLEERVMGLYSVDFARAINDLPIFDGLFL